MKKLFSSLFIMAAAFTLNAQEVTVKTILDNYFENTGGRANWEKLDGFKMTGSIAMQGMEIPFESVELKDGRKITRASFQGMEFIQDAFDGEVSWSTNFMNMQPEKSDAETTENTIRSANEFPSPLLNYEGKKIGVEYLGTATVEGVECYKLKVTKQPELVDGKDVDNIEFYYFDQDSYVPIMVESEMLSGQMKGTTVQTVLSDYEEYEGLYFPMAISVKIKDGQSMQTIVMNTIELNPDVPADLFAFPGDN